MALPLLPPTSWSLDKHLEAELPRLHDSGGARVSVSCMRCHMGGMEKCVLEGWIVKPDSQTVQSGTQSLQPPPPPPAAAADKPVPAAPQTGTQS